VSACHGIGLGGGSPDSPAGPRDHGDPSRQPVPRITCRLRSRLRDR
jgi:hypothetical protein